MLFNEEHHLVAVILPNETNHEAIHMENIWPELSDKTVVITGGGSGIGRSTAEMFAANGARVAILDMAGPAAAETAEIIRKNGGTCLSFAVNVTDEKQVKHVAKEVETAFGDVSVVVNNAGILRPSKIEEAEIAQWNLMMQVNVGGYLIVSQAFFPQLHRTKGSIVNTASIAGSQPQAFSGAYSPSKAAVVMLSRLMAFEFGPKGVRSNSVSPGLIKTPLTQSFYAEEGVEEARSAMVPLQRVGEPSDIAAVILWLASDRSRYVTGQDICVDGGLSQALMAAVPRPGFEKN